MRGRKSKPTYLKVLDGNPGRRSSNPGEPQPPRRTPTCPSHLCPPAKAEWRRLAAQLTVLRVLTELDRAALVARFIQIAG
jgi:phage terminase small subunit